MKKVSFLVLTAILLTACQNKSTETNNEEVAQETVQTNNSSDEHERFTTSNITSVEFETSEHPFGKVFQNTDNFFSFKLKNTGKKPLVIENAKASCGCTIPKSPDGPIKPGETSEIQVIFHPSLSQEGKMSKTITVKANTYPEITQLRITAEVMKRMMD